MPSEIDASRAQALAIIPKMLDLVGDQDMDAEDLDDFEGALRSHIEGTNLRCDEDVPGFRMMAGVRCPFYAHESLARHAGLANSLQRNGDRLIAQAMVGEAGQLLIRFSPRFRDVLTRSDSEGASAWQRWMKGQPFDSAAALNSCTSLDDLPGLLPRAGDMYRIWFIAMEPAIRFGLRVLPEKKIKSVLGKVESLFEKSGMALMSGLRNDLESRIRERLDQSLIDRIKSESSIKTLGMYNYLTRDPAPGVERAIAHRNRHQALAGYRNLSPLLADFHNGGQSHNQLRAAVDRGEKIPELLLSLTQPDGITAIRSFLKANLEDLGGTMQDININWMRNYVRALSQFPVQRYPKTAQELVIASELSQSSADMEVIAKATGQPPMDLWEGLLKQGWSNASKSLAAVMVEDLPESDIATAGLAMGGLMIMRNMVDNVRSTFSGINGEIDADRMTQVLLGGRGIGRMLDSMREYRLVEDQANEVKMPRVDDLPEECEWFPLLPTRSITVDEVVFTEMRNEDDLRIEGEELDHCVATYARRCRQDGFRIFKVRWTPAKGGEVKGTLSIIINDTFNGHTLNQFRAEGNERVDERLNAASIQLRNGIDDGTIRSDMDGFRRDLNRVESVRSHHLLLENAKRARMECFNEGLVFLMPPVCAGMTLSAFAQSEFAAKELVAIDNRATARLAVEEMTKVRAATLKEEAVSFGFG